MNAGAYGSDWSRVLVRALVVDPAGAGWLTLDELDLGYRHSALRPGQVVAEVEFRLSPRPPDEVKRTVAELNAQRKATQPTNRRTFGSVFKNPDHELGAGRMLEACGLKGHRIGGAQISPVHANFIENTGEATAADALALMAEARRRALDEFGVVLEREVELDRHARAAAGGRAARVGSRPQGEVTRRGRRRRRRAPAREHSLPLRVARLACRRAFAGFRAGGRSRSASR